MNKATTCLATFLLILSTSAFSDDRSTPWLVSWPFFQSDTASHSINNGYGDWCSPIEGAHPGLDFGVDPDDLVLLPTDNTSYTLLTHLYPNIGYAVIFGLDSSSQEGWGVMHLDIDNPFAWPFQKGSMLMNHDSLAPCFQYGSAPLHMHLQWVEVVGGQPPINPPGMYNPFDFFEDNLSDYDEVQFKHVWYEERLFPSRRRGIWFTPDEFEAYNDLPTAPGHPTQVVFQDIISGAVDIAVSPFSAFQGVSDYDSAGVYSVSYEILQQDPNTLDYVPAASGTDNYGERFLMEMHDELPNGDTPGYRAIFLDGQRPDGTGVLDWDYYKNAYIVTNSGALDPSSWTTGWDNVWTGPSQSSWTTGICQGAWDTNLQLPPNTGEAQTNADAFFPDGKYAVRVTAVSHGSRDTDSLTLPVDDLSLPDPQVEGVIVDNFLPHIERVAVYSWDPSASTCYLIYEGYWEDIDTDRVRERESEHLEPGCCLDERIGQDPVNLLLKEIARVENQQTFDTDTTRIFTDETYRYLPGPGHSSPEPLLVLQVFYSEPIMTESFIQLNNLGQLHLKGTIGNLTTWLSYNHGKFVRQPGSFQLPLTSDNTAGIELESDNAFFDNSYVVHYIFEGKLPREYVGNIQLYFGNPGQPVGGGPLDLAGNTLDSYPGTVPESRNDYGPFLYNGFEWGPDTNYSWGVPDWDHHVSTDIVYGTVGIENELVATVDLNSIGLEDAWFIGDCDYWCGFWMYHDVYDEYGFNIYVVKPDGSYIDHSFKTPFPVGGLNYEQNWWGNSVANEILSPDGRYFWMTGYVIDLIDNISPAFAYCVDSETGARIDGYEVCTGYSFWWYVGCICFSQAEILSIDSNGVAYIQFGYHEVMSDTSMTVGLDTLPPPGGSDDNLFGDIYCASDISSDAEEVIEILSNPVRETLGVRLVGVSGDNFELLLYDIAGRQILAESGILREDESLLNIGVQELPSGVYLLRIRTGDLEVVRTVSIIH